MNLFEKLETTYQSAAKYADKFGKRARSDERSEWSLVHAAAFLKSKGLSIDWQGPTECPFGYDTIWDYCAGEYHAMDQKPAKKVKAAQEYSVEMRNGFLRLKERVMEEHGLVLFNVPRKVDNQQIVVITLHSDYVVNQNGETAGEIQRMRDEKLVKGQIKSSFKRSALLVGKDEARDCIDRILNNIATEPLLLPRGNPFSNYSQQLFPAEYS
mgnify:CR=1 FL=1